MFLFGLKYFRASFQEHMIHSDGLRFLHMDTVCITHGSEGAVFISSGVVHFLSNVFLLKKHLFIATII